jgi:hypothetical protein
MEHDENSEGAARTGVATNVVEAVVAAVLLAIGLVVIVESQRLGSGWTSDGPGAGYFPFYIGAIIAISGAGILYQALLGKEKKTEIFVDSVQLKRVLSVLLPAIVYVLAISSLFMVFLGKYSWVKSVIAALVVNTVFFFMFEVWFKVPLFKGALDPLRFLGY